jgi:hypothetical protein
VTRLPHFFALCESAKSVRGAGYASLDVLHEAGPRLLLNEMHVEYRGRRDGGLLSGSLFFAYHSLGNSPEMHR